LHKNAWNGVGNIFGTRFLRAKFFSRRVGGRPQLNPAPAGGSRLWKRVLLLASVLAGVVFVGVVKYCDPAFSKVAMAEIVAALKGPLDLFAERSPGGRGARALISIKPIKRPHERVLSAVRERPHVIPPGLDSAVFAAAPEAVASIPMVPPQYDTQPVDRIFSPPPFFPGIIPTGLVPGSPPSTPVLPPAGPPTGPDVPPIIVGPPPPGTPVPPGVPETPPPVTIVLPEPATWAMTIFGLFAIGLRRRVRSRSA